MLVFIDDSIFLLEIIIRNVIERNLFVTEEELDFVVNLFLGIVVFGIGF